MNTLELLFICPSCMCSSFWKNEEFGTYICVDCGEECEYYELDMMEYEVPKK